MKSVVLAMGEENQFEDFKSDDCSYGRLPGTWSIAGEWKNIVQSTFCS